MPVDLTVLAPAERAALALRGLYERYGYRQYRMSQFEEYSLYMDNKSFLESESVAVFTDLDGRLMALKPDVTLSIVRHAAPNPTAAEKLYYTENVFRPSEASHTFKEISQIGIEYIGRLDSYAKGEVTALAAATLFEVSPDCLLEIGHMGFTVGLLDALGLCDGARAAALTALRQKNAAGLAAAAAAAGLTESDAAALTALPSLYGGFAATRQRAQALCRSPRMAAALAELDAVFAAAQAAGAQARLELDLSLAGDTDYYNGLLLRGYLQGLPRAALTGGQYDSILHKFKKQGGGIGFALDLSLIALLPAPRPAADIDLLVRYAPAADPAAVAAAVADAARRGLRVRALPQTEDDSGLRAAGVFVVGAAGEGTPC